MYKGKKVIHIVACGASGEIGKDNKLLWKIREDLQFFKESTLGHVVLMGRNTFESLPKPLSRRSVLEVTRKHNRKYGGTLSREGVLLANLNIATNNCKDLNTDCIFIAGGGEIYKATEKYVDEVWYTLIHENFDADTFYHVPDGFDVVAETPFKLVVNENTGKFVGVQWLTYKRT